MASKQIFNAKSQAVEEAELSVDQNNEIVATFKDGSIVKFPAGLTASQFDKLIQQHQETNEGQEVITEEMEAAKAKERAKSLELIGDTTPESQSNDDTSPAPN